MTRETRLNLWFLAIFLVISLPGAVILFIKKLDPAASRMDAPDAVLTRLPYMAPLPAPPEMRWMVPPLTHQWLAELTRQKAGGAMASAVPPGPEWEPVISADHRLQVMSVSSADGSTHLAVMLWDSSPLEDVGRAKLKLRANGRDLPATILHVDPVEIPQAVRHELVDLGFAHPPTRVEWLDCEAKGPIEPDVQATLTLARAATPATESSVSWTER